MPIDITLPALSPTMETGTLSKWLVKVGDAVKSGDLLAEIETDKATMEVENIEEGTVAELVVAEGSEGVKVGAVIARLSAEGEAAGASPSSPKAAGEAAKGSQGAGDAKAPASLEPSAGQTAGGSTPADATPTDHGRPADATTPVAPAEQPAPLPASQGSSDAGPALAREVGDAAAARVNASPLARRLAQARGLDLAAVAGSGPNGRVVKADVDAAQAPAAAPKAEIPAVSPTVPATAPSVPTTTPAVPKSSPTPANYAQAPAIPHEAVKLGSIRKITARRLTESKQTVPHFYLTVDVRLDALLKLRGELNAGLEKSGVKLSVNDLLIKALAVALIQVPESNVQFAGDTLYKFSRADISVAVAIPGGLITPIIVDAANKRLSVIATEAKDLAERARAGKLKPEEYNGGTASISNLGMFGIKQFDAVINPPQALIMAVGAGEKRPYVVGDALAIATVMSATGSFDHRAIDGATGAQLMSAFKALVENPLAMLA